MSYNPYSQPPQNSPQSSGSPYSGQPHSAGNPLPPYGAMRSMGFPPGPDQRNPNPAITEPWYGIDFWEATKRAYKKTFRFKGFASRSEFWWAYLSMSIVYMVLMFICCGIFFLMMLPAIGSIDDQTSSEAVVAGSLIGVLAFLGVFYLVSFALLFPMISLTVRRLHDAGYSGWFYLLSFVPFGAYVILFFCISETNTSKWRQEWIDDKP